MKRCILLLLTLVIANNAMDEDTMNISIRLPNLLCLQIKCSYGITLKQLKEAIYTKYNSENMPLPINEQFFQPIQQHPLFRNVIKLSSEQITNDTIRVSELVLAYHTSFFNLKIGSTNTQ